jgi:hypothetical protein
MGDTHVKIDVKTLKHQKSEYSLSVGKLFLTSVSGFDEEIKKRYSTLFIFIFFIAFLPLRERYRSLVITYGDTMFSD